MNAGYETHRRVDIPTALQERSEALAGGMSTLLEIARDDLKMPHDILRAFVNFLTNHVHEDIMGLSETSPTRSPTAPVLHTARTVIGQLRVGYCPHTLAINCQAWDEMFCRLLFDLILPNAHSCTWPRLIKGFIFDDFNESEPFDGSTGKIISLQQIVDTLLSDVAADDAHAVEATLANSSVSLINYHDSSGWTLMHHASHHGSVTVMSVLMKEGLGINELSAGARKDSPLHIAAASMSASSLAFLVNNGASLSLRNSSMMTPLQLLLGTLSRARATTVPSFINDLPNLIRLLVSHPNDLWTPSPSSAEASESYWVFESTTPLFMGALSLYDNSFEALFSTAAVTVSSEPRGAELARCLLCCMSRGRMREVALLLQYFGPTLFHHKRIERDWAHTLMHEALTLAIDRHAPSTVLSKLLALKDEDAVLRVNFSPLPVYAAVMQGDILSLTMLLDRGYASQGLCLLDNHNYPLWKESCYLTPLSAVCLKGDALSWTKIVAALPGGRLTSAQYLTMAKLGMSPLVCIALSLSTKTLMAIRKYMHPRDFSIACNSIDACGYLPIHVLAARVRVLANAGLAFSEHAEDATRICTVFVGEVTNAVGSEEAMDNLLSLKTVWSDRRNALQAHLVEAQKKEDGLRAKTLASHSSKKLDGAVQTASDLSSRSVRLAEIMSSPSMIPDLRVLLATKKLGRSAILIIRSIVVLLTKSSSTAIGSKEEADIARFRNLATAYDKFVTDLRSPRKVIDRLTPYRWKQAKDFMDTIGTHGELTKVSWRYDVILSTLKEWVMIVLEDAALLHDFTVEKTEKCTVEETMPASTVAQVARDTVQLAAYRRILTEVISNVSNGLAKLSTTAATAAFSVLVGCDRFTAGLCDAFRCHNSFAASMLSLSLPYGKDAISRCIPLLEKHGKSEVNINLLDSVAKCLVAGFLGNMSSGFIDTLGQSIFMALCSNSCWGAATLVLETLPESEDMTNMVLRKCYHHGTLHDFFVCASPGAPDLIALLRDSGGCPSTSPVLSWDTFNVGKVVGISAVDLLLKARQLDLLNKFQKRQKTFSAFSTARETVQLAHRLEAFQECILIATLSYDMSGYGPPVLERLGGKSKGMLHMVDCKAQLRDDLVNRRLISLNRGEVRTGYSIKAKAQEIRHAALLRQFLDVSLARSKDLVKTMAHVQLHDSSESDELANTINPQYEGKFAGLCLFSGVNDVLMMDGTRRSPEEFSKDLALLPLAMPAPALPGGALCSGYHLLHAITRHATENDACELLHVLSNFGSNVGTLALASDISGRTPLYEAIDSGRVGVSLRLLEYVDDFDGRTFTEKVLQATVQHPSKAVDIKNLFYPRVERWLKQATATYNRVALAHRMGADLWQWPTPCDQALLDIFKRLDELWDIISSDSFSPHVSNMYGNHMNVLACVSQAKSILSALALPASKIAGTRESLLKPTPSKVKSFLPDESYKRLKQALSQICCERHSMVPMNASFRSLETMTQVYKLFRHNLLDCFEKPQEEAFLADQDLCSSICAGRGLPTHVFHELRLHCLRASPSAATAAYLGNSLEEFMKIWRSSQQLIHDVTESARYVIEFGRLLCLARTLTFVTRVNFDPLSPNPYGHTTIFDGVECQEGSEASEDKLKHPLDRIINDLNDAQDASNNAHSLHRSVKDSQARRNVSEKVHPRGVMTRVTLLDNLSRKELDVLLSTRVGSSWIPLKASLACFAALAEGMGLPSSSFTWCNTSTETSVKIPALQADSDIRTSIHFSSKDADIIRHVDEFTGTLGESRSLLLAKMRKVTIKDILKHMVSMHDMVSSVCSQIRSFGSGPDGSVLMATDDDIDTYKNGIKEDNIVSDDKENTALQSHKARGNISKFVSGVYETSNKLAAFLFTIEGVLAYADLYKIDVMECLPSRILNPLNALVAQKGDSRHDFIECCRRLLSIGADPVGADASGYRPIVIAAVLGKLEALTHFLFKYKDRLRDEFRDPALEKDDSLRYILWHMLMACPAPNLSNQGTTALRRNYEDCVILLLNGGLRVELAYKGNALGTPTDSPDGVKLSCIDLIGLKQLPRVLKLMLLMGEISQSVDEESQACPDISYLSIISPALREDSSVVHALLTRTRNRVAPVSIRSFFDASAILLDCRQHDEFMRSLRNDSSYESSVMNTARCLRAMLPDSCELLSTRHLCPLSRGLKQVATHLENQSSRGAMKMPSHESLVWGPLHFALAVKSAPLADMIITRFGPLTTDPTIQHYAAFYGNARAFEALATFSAATDFSHEGMFEPLGLERTVSPLDVSIRVGSTRILECMVRQAGDALKQQVEWRHFREACCKSAPTIALLLFRRLASKIEPSEMVTELRAKEDPDGFLDGETVVHVLARRGTLHPDAKTLLHEVVEHGADIDIKDKFGLIPLQCSVSAGNAMATRLLGGKSYKCSKAVLKLSVAIRHYLLRRNTHTFSLDDAVATISEYNEAAAQL